MDTRLRAWASTGEYIEEPEARTSPGSGGGRFRATARMEGVMIAALVPVGIVMGALLAAAFLVRLLMLPLSLVVRPREDRCE